MDVVEFFKTVNRLRKNQRCCKECPIHKNDDMGCMVRADDDSIKSIDETVSKVEQWANTMVLRLRGFRHGMRRGYGSLCGYWWSVWLCWCVSQRRCRPGLHSQSRIPQSAPEHGICRGDIRMTQLQEAIHNKITTYSEDE